MRGRIVFRAAVLLYFPEINMITTDGSSLVETLADSEHPREMLKRLEEKLLPCPFCGKWPTIHARENASDLQVFCNCKLGPSTPRCNDERRYHLVALIWNQRKSKP